MINYLKIAKQMGLRWTLYQAKHRVRTAMGNLEKTFPTTPPYVHNNKDLQDFRLTPPKYFFHSDALQIPKSPDENLRGLATAVRNHELLYFNNETLPLPLKQPWHAHPLTSYCFDNLHWAKVDDFNPACGDIKYVWEPSRFSHLYILVRDDHHNQNDNGAFVLNQIKDWLQQNPINQGPNYKCSQEISLRLLNWNFALHYYRAHPALTDQLWNDIKQNIYWSVHHVYHHIDFSRIAVRNNHAITETLLVWLSAKLFPWFEDFKPWSVRGKCWFEEEISYQIHDDGTYIQHSHNYQRVVIQLLSVGIKLGEIYSDKLSEATYEQAHKALIYLQNMMQPNGELPNYGPNDGALFFPLAQQSYRDYRPQLNALARILRTPTVSPNNLEEGDWLGALPCSLVTTPPEGQLTYPNGGIYAFRQNGLFLFAKCQAYQDRPNQADNLHLDLWIGGQNVLRDQGTYRYNASTIDQQYFFGTASHNTIQLDDADQMKKGARFVFFDWTRLAEAEWTSPTTLQMSVDAYAHLGKGIQLSRIIEVQADKCCIRVTDSCLNLPAGVTMKQLWHPNPKWESSLEINAVDAFGAALQVAESSGSYSSTYGHKETCIDWTFSTASNEITTTVSWF